MAKTTRDRRCGAGLLMAAVLTLGGVAGATQAQAQTASGTGQVTRTFNWNGGEHLAVGVPGHVRFVPGAASKVTITGPADIVDHMVVERGDIHPDREVWGWWFWPRRHSRDVEIVVTAPRLSDVHVGGAADVELGQLSQDRLDLELSGAGGAHVSGAFRSLHVWVSGAGGARLDGVRASEMEADLSGSGWIKASGTAQSLRLLVSGAGHADMSALSVDDVEAGLSGSGSARIAPKRSAEIGVSGAGSVRLMTTPARLVTHRSGAGSIIRPDGSN